MEKVTVFAENILREECIPQALELFAELVEKTNKEDGCITYTLYQDDNNKSHFFFFEEWENQAALDAHIQSPHFKEIVPKIGEMAAKGGSFLSGKKLF